MNLEPKTILATYGEKLSIFSYFFSKGMISFFSRSFPTTLDRDKKVATTIKPAETIRTRNNFISCRNVLSNEKMKKCHNHAKDMRGKNTPFSFEAFDLTLSVRSSLPFYAFFVQNGTLNPDKVQSCLVSFFFLCIVALSILFV